MKMCLKELIIKYKFKLLLLVLIIGSITGAQIIFSYEIGIFLDNIKFIFDRQGKVHLLIILGGMVLIELLGTYLKNLLEVKTVTLMMYDIFSKAYEHMKRIPLKEYAHIDTMFYTNSINIDSYTITDFILTFGTVVVIDTIKIISLTGLIFSISAGFGLITVVMVLLYACLYLILKKILYSRNVSFKESQSKFFSAMYKQIDKIRVTKINAWYDVLAQKLKEAFETNYIDMVRKNRVSILYSDIGLFIGKLGIFAMIIYCGNQIGKSMLTIGSFIVLERYFTFLIGSITSYVEAFKKIPDAKVSYERMDKIFKTPIEQNGETYISEIDKIELNHVSFGYDSKVHVINNFSGSFEKGKSYALVGHNGCGKSTLINLILGLYQDYDGKILFNDINQKELDIYRIRKLNMAVVEQEPVLLADTVKNNLSYGMNHPDMSTLKEWCNRVNILDLIESFDGGFSYKITDTTSNLSGGEKQKLAIVRAMVKNSDVIIFDEPTSAIDVKGRNRVIDIIKNYCQDKIVILISHDEKVFGICDNVIELSA